MILLTGIEKEAERERQKAMLCDSHNVQPCDNDNVVREDSHTLSRDSHATE